MGVPARPSQGGARGRGVTAVSLSLGALLALNLAGMLFQSACGGAGRGEPGFGGSSEGAAGASGAALAAGKGAHAVFPAAVLAKEAASRHVARAIVPAVVPALAAELRRRGVSAAAVVGCEANKTIALDLAAAGVAPHCVGSLADVDAFLAAYAEDRGAELAAAAGGQQQHRHMRLWSPLGGHAAGAGGAALPPAASALRVRAAGKPEDTAAALLFGQVLAAAPGGLGALPVAEVALDPNTTTPTRAVLVHAPAWPTAGQRSAWFAQTRVYLDAFNAVYREKKWTNEGGGSGQGSTIPYTVEVRKALPDIIRRYGIRSMIDSSCGSMVWMPMVLAQVEKERRDFRFFGSDVVCDLIEDHQDKFADAHPNWDFGCIDYANQPLPSGYDLVWSRDSLQHVPFHAAYQFLNNVRASGARYLLVGSYLQYKNSNTDIKAGEYYAINIKEPPFNLRPAPLEVIDEHSEIAENNTQAMRKYMLLYDVATLEWDDDLSGLT